MSREILDPGSGVFACTPLGKREASKGSPSPSPSPVLSPSHGPVRRSGSHRALVLGALRSASSGAAGWRPGNTGGIQIVGKRCTIFDRPDVLARRREVLQLLKQHAGRRPPPAVIDEYDDYDDQWSDQEQAWVHDLAGTLADGLHASGLSEAQVLDMLTRELTQDDYDALLQLDETVPRKTVEDGVIEGLRRAACSEGACGVCLVQFEGEAACHLPCEHSFHEDCIRQWLCEYKNTCPLCKIELPGSRKINE